ncbi:hypothetical protein SB658_27230, partial [Bacillus sp. SIMBA_008]|uniref:hypothetical protein n=1 Tax=Bacillus sp. SIMBA_008 TaxID=3085757 RepID=UPI0039784A4D
WAVTSSQALSVSLQFLGSSGGAPKRLGVREGLRQSCQKERRLTGSIDVFRRKLEPVRDHTGIGRFCRPRPSGPLHLQI